MPEAKGLLLVFNQANALHNRPNDFRLLTASVLRKRDKDSVRRFPHIHGLVYFSYDTVKSEKENMNFWAALQLKTDPDEDLTPMADFQRELQEAWYAFVEQKWGKKVRQFLGE
jgi:DNA phosphorothioation-dependent restriction protein DptG